MSNWGPFLTKWRSETTLWMKTTGNSNSQWTPSLRCGTITSTPDSWTSSTKSESCRGGLIKALQASIWTKSSFKNQWRVLSIKRQHCSIIPKADFTQQNDQLPWWKTLIKTLDIWIPAWHKLKAWKAHLQRRNSSLSEPCLHWFTFKCARVWA